MIDTQTKLFGVIGDPIEHSLSPLMQNWMIRLFGRNAVYTAFHVRQDELASAMQGMKALKIAGFNVTIPHKEAVVRYATEKSHEVALLNAANTLKHQDNAISAHVTDPAGFIESLSSLQKMFDGASVVLLGAGGSARSIAYALSVLKVNQLTIVNRTAERAAKLSHMARSRFGIPVVRTLTPDDARLNDAIEASTILINATSVGMYPHVDASPLPDHSAINSAHFVYDLIYNPAKTFLLRQAEKRGAGIQNGLDMLIFQGLESLRFWFDEQFVLDSASLTELRTILNKALGNE